MASLNYPVVLQADDNGAILVTFPDIPEAATYGDDRADALAHAVDALDAAIAFRVRDKEDIPTPSPARGRPTVTLPLQTALKALIYQTMRDNGVRKATLKRRLGWNDPQVDRLSIRLQEETTSVEELHNRIHDLGAGIRMFQAEAMDMETAFMKLTQGKTA